MLFHRFFNDRLKKVLRVIKSLTVRTDWESYYFFLLFQNHLGITFSVIRRTGRLYFTNPIKKAKCTNKCLKNIGVWEIFCRGGGGKPFAQKILANVPNFYKRVEKERGPYSNRPYWRMKVARYSFSGSIPSLSINYVAINKH